MADKSKPLPTMEAIQYEYLRTLEELEAYCIENDTDEVPEDFMERLNINRNELEHKLYNYYLFMQTLEGQKDKLLEEAARLTRKSSRLQKTNEYLKAVIDKAVEKFGSDIMGKNKLPTGNLKIQSPFVNISRIGTKSVEVIDENVIPDKYHLIDISFSNLTVAEKKKLESHLTAIQEILKQPDPFAARVKEVDKINKSTLKADLETGQSVEGAELKTNHHLRFS